MKLLLDTHTLLWLMDGPASLSPRATTLLTDPANQLYLSMASVWEIGIKTGLKKLRLSVPLGTFLDTAIQGYLLTLLPITTDDCIRYEQLPFPDPNHRDPFDRMIIVHTFRYGFAVLGGDKAFDAYGVTRLW